MFEDDYTIDKLYALIREWRKMADRIKHLTPLSALEARRLKQCAQDVEDILIEGLD